MSFSDEKHGQIDIVYDGGDPPTNRLAYLTTSDSGLTWKESGSLPLNAFKFANNEKGDYFEAINAYIKKNSNDYSQSVSHDGSLWKVDYKDKLAQIIISRHLDIGDWTITSILPQTFGYADGQVTIP